MAELTIPSLVDLIKLWAEEEHLKIKFKRGATIIDGWSHSSIIWGVLHKDADYDRSNFLCWIFESENPYITFHWRDESDSYRLWPANPEFFTLLYSVLVQRAAHLGESEIR